MIAAGISISEGAATGEELARGFASLGSVAP